MAVFLLVVGLFFKVFEDVLTLLWVHIREDIVWIAVLHLIFVESRNFNFVGVFSLLL